MTKTAATETGALPPPTRQTWRCPSDSQKPKARAENAIRLLIAQGFQQSGFRGHLSNFRLVFSCCLWNPFSTIHSYPVSPQDLRANFSSNLKCNWDECASSQAYEKRTVSLAQKGCSSFPPTGFWLWIVLLEKW